MRGVTTAKQLVDYCNSQEMFRGINQLKHTAAITTRRSYHHLTRDEVERITPSTLVQERRVKTLKGNENISECKKAAMADMNCILVNCKI